MFSGYLFFYNIKEWNKIVYIEKLKSRIKTLLIPYVLWNTISVSVTPFVIIAGRLIKQDNEWDRLSLFFNGIMEKGIWNIYWHYNTWGERTNALGWPVPSYGPYSAPMWFLETLMVISICTPLIYLLCKKLRHYGIITLGILYYTRTWIYLPGFGIGPIFFFSIGAYYSIYKRNMVIELRRYKTISYITAIATMVLCVYYDGIRIQDNIYPIYVLAGVISAVNIASCLMEKGKVKVNKLLSKSTFFVYAMHTVLVLSIVGMIFDCIIKSESPIVLIVRYICVPIITIIICVITYWILGKIAPMLQKILSGNR
jgi:peptidoglycan/LPS O-acetylase OafA/YrhL